MKNLLLTGITALIFNFALHGCGNDKVYSSMAVPSQVLNEFHNMYPAAHDVKWKSKKGIYQADFEIGHDDVEAAFNSNGDLVWSKL